MLVKYDGGHVERTQQLLDSILEKFNSSTTRIMHFGQKEIIKVRIKYYFNV